MIFRKPRGRRTRRREILIDRIENKSLNYRSGSARGSSSKINNDVSISALSGAKQLWRILVVLVALFSVGYMVHASKVPIIRITDGSRPTREVDEYRTSITKLISQNIQNRTKLTFSYSSISESVRKQFPEISSVSINFAIFGDQPVISLDFYEPAIVVNSQGKDWIVDTRGVAVAELSNDQLKRRYENFLKVRDDVGLVGNPGNSLMASKDVSFILAVKEYFEGKGIDVESTIIPANPREVIVRLINRTYGIRISLDEDPRAQVGTALAAEETLQGSGVMPTEYIDVRPGEKVYWR